MATIDEWRIQARHWENRWRALHTENTELRNHIELMLSHGHRCNWFADRGDFELVHTTEAILAKTTGTAPEQTNCDSGGNVQNSSMISTERDPGEL